MESPQTPWWRLLSRYHWFVFIVASAAWFFDCLDQRLFSLARIPALADLMNLPASDAAVQAFGKEVTACFLVGWGIGGMIFGALGDRYGRARMLTVTILIYSGFTGLTFISHNKIDFTIYRFLTGLGVGGVFGLAVALIAETVPNGARTQALGLLQVLSTVGNVGAGLAKMGIDSLEKHSVIAMGSGWRWMFLIGAIPALMIIFTRKKLKEPEAWQRLKDAGKLPKGSILGSYSVLLGDARWRRNLIVGALVASTGVVGLWAIGEYAVDLQTAIFKTHYEQRAAVELPKAVEAVQAAEAAVAGAVPAAQAALDQLAAAKKALAAEIKSKVENTKTITYLLQMFGGAAGMWFYTRLASATGRRLAFFVGFLGAMLVTAFVYLRINTPWDAYWMMPLMGAAQLGPFACFAIYLPELFPSRLRSTGTSFCYNLGRFAAAVGSFSSAQLTEFFKNAGHTGVLPLRYSAVTMCAIFLVGIVTIFFAPETRGQPLPEEDPVAEPEDLAGVRRA